MSCSGLASACLVESGKSLCFKLLICFTLTSSLCKKLVASPKESLPPMASWLPMTLQLHDELSDYWIVVADQLSSHHGQAILVDKKTFATAVLHALKGTSSSAPFLHKSGLELEAFFSHLPHHHQPVSDYSAATTELQQAEAQLKFRFPDKFI